VWGRPGGAVNPAEPGAKLEADSRLREPVRSTSASLVGPQMPADPHGRASALPRRRWKRKRTMAPDWSARSPRSLVVYLKRAGGQSQFSVLVEADPPPQSALRVVTAAIAAHPAADHGVKSLAAHAFVEHPAVDQTVSVRVGHHARPACRIGPDRGDPVPRWMVGGR
jgi:hypothetical protein